MTPIDEAKPWVEMHRDASRQIAVLEMSKAMCRQKITEALAGDDTGTIDGRVAVKVKMIPGRLDGKRLRTDHPDIASGYIGPESMRFSVVPSAD